MDKITISNLEIYGFHGVHPEENVLGQKFLIDAILYLDIREAGLSDKLSSSVSYGDVIRLFNREMNRQKDQLIERACERLAKAVLCEFPLVEKLELTVKKPYAPVLNHIDYVAVTIERRWHKVYIGAGSNMGDKASYLDYAVKGICEDDNNRNFREAARIVTEPWGYKEQDEFLNTVFAFDTLYQPLELLDKLQDIEREAGRSREIHWGPRTLDLDILLYDKEIIEGERLIIPHPLMDKRLFVITPLCELHPYGIHPLTGERFCKIKENLLKNE